MSKKACKKDAIGKKTCLENELRFVTFGSGGNVIQSAVAL